MEKEILNSEVKSAGGRNSLDRLWGNDESYQPIGEIIHGRIVSDTLSVSAKMSTSDTNKPSACESDMHGFACCTALHCIVRNTGDDDEYEDIYEDGEVAAPVQPVNSLTEVESTFKPRKAAAEERRREQLSVDNDSDDEYETINVDDYADGAATENSPFAFRAARQNELLAAQQQQGETFMIIFHFRIGTCL